MWHYHSGWGHKECHGDSERGLEAIERSYHHKVQYGDYLIENGNGNGNGNGDYLCLMEDEEDSKQQSSPTCVGQLVVTSSNMEEEGGMNTSRGRVRSNYVPRQLAGTFEEEAQKNPRVQTTCSSSEEDEDDTKPPQRKLARVVQHADSCAGNESDDYSAAGAKHSMTNEQERILAYEPEMGEVVCINALAGCGKTTTIALLCNGIHAKDPSMALLYLVFNKKNEREAKESKKMPKDNMEIRTTHAFALRHYFGTDHMHDVNPLHEYELEDIISSLELGLYCQRTFRELYESRDQKKIQRRLNAIARFIRKTVQKFQASSDTVLQAKHVFWRATYVNYSRANKQSRWKEKVNVEQYVSWASEFFNNVRERCHSVKNGGEGVVGITHDGYLKVAQMEHMQIPFDVIMVDEAQDMTPCQADLLWGSNQRRDSVIYLLGDVYQQIYRFRGAGDSFHDKWKLANTSFSLRGSFRFGKNIAAYASCVLQAIGGEKLFGRAVFNGNVYVGDEMNSKGVVLCRTNNGMYQFLHSHQPKRWCYLRGRSSKPPPEPTKTQILLEKFLAKESDGFSYKREFFSSIEEIKEFAQDEDDSALLRSLGLLSYLKAANKTITSFFQEIQKSFCALGDYESPDDYNGVILGTVHTAKGLEFDNVFIFDDYKFGVIENSTQGIVTPFDEAHIVYVAITRARRNLLLSTRAYQCLYDLAKGNDIRLPTLVSSESLSELRSKWEKEWKLFKELTPIVETIDDIPWPPNWNCPHNCLSLDRNMDESERRRYIKRIRLAFHPDKFLPIHGSYILLLATKDQIQERLQEIMRNCTSCCEQQQLEFDSDSYY